MTRGETPLDAATILRRLAAHDVECLVIGGLAAQAHGHLRTTQDVDLLPAPEIENLDRLAAALIDLGARPAGERPTRDALALDGRWLRDAQTIALDTDAGGVDVHLAPAGAGAYADLRQRALELEVADVAVAVVGLDDLIAMKRASRRPLDRGEVIALASAERDRGK